jgi:hypothetical protein
MKAMRIGLVFTYSILILEREKGIFSSQFTGVFPLSMRFGMKYEFTGKTKALAQSIVNKTPVSPHLRLNGRRPPAHRPGTDPSMRAGEQPWSLSA